MAIPSSNDLSNKQYVIYGDVIAWKRLPLLLALCKGNPP